MNLEKDTQQDKDKYLKVSFNSEEHFFKQNMQLLHETWRTSMWADLKESRSKLDPERQISLSIRDKETLLKDKVNVDKILLNSIKIALVDENHMKVLSYVKQIQLLKTLNLVALLCEKMNAHSCASTIRL